MPTVPVYQTNQVRDQALQGGFQQEVDVTKNARALAQGLGVAGQMLDRGVIREAEAASSKADTEIAAGWLQWDAANRKNFQGEKADGYQAAAQQWWGKAAQTYGSSLDPMAKGLVSQSLNRRQAASLGQVAQFVEVEKEKHADNTYAANVATSVQFAVSSGDVAGGSQRVRELSAQVGARKGWNTEEVQAETLKNLSQLHVSQIAKLTELPGGAALADKYYQDNKTEIAFAAQPKIEQVIKAEVDNQKATQTAAEAAPLPLADQLALAAKIEDPALREKTLMQMKNNYSLAREAKREVEQKFADDAWQLVGKNKKVPEAILMGMDGRERVQLQEHLRVKADRLTVGKTVKTDWKTYIDTREALFNGTKVNLAGLTEKIAPAQLEQLLDIQTKTSKPGKLPEVAMSEQQIGAYTNTLNLGGENNATKRGQFTGAAQDLFNEHLKRTGKEPDFDERQKILDKLTTSVVTKKGFLWDDTAPAYTLPRDQVRSTMQPTTAPATAPKEKFTVGQTYTDAKGNRATYAGAGKWNPAQ